MCVSERDRESVCLSERDRESVCVVREIERVCV